MPAGLRDLDSIDHEFFIQAAIDKAVIAGRCGDKPIAAVLGHESRVIGFASLPSPHAPRYSGSLTRED
jgi:hypothetical protein